MRGYIGTHSLRRVAAAARRATWSKERNRISLTQHPSASETRLHLGIHTRGRDFVAGFCDHTVNLFRAFRERERKTRGGGGERAVLGTISLCRGRWRGRETDTEREREREREREGERETCMVTCIGNNVSL